MRVIAGSARRLPLKMIEGRSTRPTTDRIKETLFNILQNDLCDCVFLDLFSGSGAIGIEALSRGAKKAYFVENDNRAVECIKENLAFTKLEHQAVVLKQDVFFALKSLEGKAVFDIIFMDAPYDMELDKKVFEELAQTSIIHDDTMIIVEASLATDFSYLEQTSFIVCKEKIYKTNKHVFIQRRA